MSSQVNNKNINSTPAAEGNNTLFVGGLSESTTKETLLNYFSSFGSVSDVNLIIDWVTGKSKRCAIIFCEDLATSSTILNHRGHCIDDRKVRVDKADSKKKGTKIVKTTKVFLGQVHPSISEGDLRDYFGTYGPIKHMKLIKNNFIPHSGAQNGFLEFFDQKHAQNLLNDRHSLFVNGFKLFCQPFRAKNAQEGEFLNLMSNMGGPALEQYLQIYFSLQMGMKMEIDFQEGSKGQPQGFNMDMMPAIAFMMQNMNRKGDMSMINPIENQQQQQKKQLSNNPSPFNHQNGSPDSFYYGSQSGGRTPQPRLYQQPTNQGRTYTSHPPQNQNYYQYSQEQSCNYNYRQAPYNTYQQPAYPRQDTAPHRYNHPQTHLARYCTPSPNNQGYHAYQQSSHYPTGHYANRQTRRYRPQLYSPQAYGSYPPYYDQGHSGYESPNYGRGFSHPYEAQSQVPETYNSPYLNKNMEEFLDEFIQTKKTKTESNANTASKTSRSNSKGSPALSEPDNFEIENLNNSSDTCFDSQNSKSEELYEEEFLREICRVGSE